MLLRFLLLREGCAERLDVDFGQCGCGGQRVVVPVRVRICNRTEKHGLEEEDGELRRIQLLVQRTNLLGGLPIARFFTILQAAAFRQTADEVVGKGIQNESCYKTKLFAPELRLHALQDYREQAVPEDECLFRFAVFGGSPGFPTEPLFFFSFPVAEVNLAFRVCADFDETAFVRTVRVNRGRQMIAEFLLGPRILALGGLSRYDFDVLRARKNGRFVRLAVVVRDLREIRHLRDTLSDVRVELAVEARGVGTRILPRFREKKRVESRPFRARRATPASGKSVSSSFEKTADLRPK